METNSSAQNIERQIELHRRLANKYELRFGLDFSRLYHEHWSHVLLSMTGQRLGELRILDCGCGSGAMLDVLTQFQGEKIAGFDISVKMLRLAQTKLDAGVPLLCANTLSLPFPDNAFDLLISRGMLHHVWDRELCVQELRRVLRCGGELILTGPSMDSPVIQTARDLLYRARPAQFSSEDRSFRSADLAKLLEGYGFRVGRLERFGFLGYVLSGYPDILPIMRWFPFRRFLTRCLIKIDEPLLRNRLFASVAFQIMISAVAT